MIEQDVIHAKQIKALSFPLAVFKSTNMERVIRQACLYTAFKPANWAKKLSSNWITRYHWSLFSEYLALGHNLNFYSPKNLRYVSGTELQPQTLEHIFASRGPQPTPRISQNILLCWVSTSTWEFFKYFALLGSQPQFQNTWIICDIPTGFKFWNHWVFLLLFIKKVAFQL